ncbi:hypothetical protein QN239_03800 [Mycolicibacterium sp. Y3]
MAGLDPPADGLRAQTCFPGLSKGDDAVMPAQIFVEHMEFGRRFAAVGSIHDDFGALAFGQRASARRNH